MNALEQLRALAQERDAISAKISAEQEAADSLRSKRLALEADQADLDGALAVAKEQLADAFQRDPSGQSEDVTNARNDIKALMRQREKAIANEHEIAAIKKAEADSLARCEPMARRLMEIAQAERDLAATRLREYGAELAARHRTAAEALAAVYAEGNAMNRIAVQADLPTIYAPVVQPLSLILHGICGSDRVVIDFSSDIDAHRQRIAGRLHAEGFKSLV